MGFRTSEVLHCCAKGITRKEANVYLHSAAQAEADFIVALGKNVHDPWKTEDVLDGGQPFCVVLADFAGDKDVEVSDGFASAT